MPPPFLNQIIGKQEGTGLLQLRLTPDGQVRARAQARGSRQPNLVQLAMRYSNMCPADVNPWDLLAVVRKSMRSSGSSRATARQRRLTQPEVGQLVERYEQLQSLRLVSAEFGIDRSTVRSHLRARGVMLEPPASMTPADVTTAIELYGQGSSSAAIGRALGFTNKTVLKELRAAGLVIRPAVARRS